MTHSFPTRRSSDLTPKEFEGSDIIAHALAVLSVSQVKHIHIVGRRGPHQNAMTPKELGELGELARAVPHVRPEDLPPEQADAALDPGLRKARSEERRVGKESVRPCRSRWSPDP